jgi:cell filamentation protein
VFYDAEPDPLCYPGSSVLINKADIRVQAELDEFELAMYLSRAAEPLPVGSLDYSHYGGIHRHLFQDVYEWAGEQRTIRIGKGGNMFCFPEHLDRVMSATFADLRLRHHLRELDRGEFAAGAAHFLAEINAGHPFREGNGRTQLAFLKVLCLNAGHGFSDEVLEPQRTMAAMIASFRGELTPLTELISDLV